MPSRERYVEPAVAEALARLRKELFPVLPFKRVSAIFDISFPAANTRRDWQHGMSTTPTGFVSLGSQGGNVQLFDVVNWTPTLAFLIADTANARVRGFFVVTEVVANAITPNNS